MIGVEMQLGRWLSLFALLWSAISHGAEGDQALVDALAAAATSAERKAAVVAIEERIAKGPLSAVHNEAIVRIATTRQSIAHHYTGRLIAAVGSRGPLSEQSRLIIAEATNGGVGFPHATRRMFVWILTSTPEPLPDEIFSTLMSGLENGRSLPIEILSATPPESPRFDSVVAAIQRLWETSTHRGVRIGAIQAIAKMYADASLPPERIDSLVVVATSDPYLALRVDVAEILATQSLDTTTTRLLSDSLAADILSPNGPERGTAEAHEFNALALRVTDVLQRIHDSPYPEHVVDVVLRLLYTSKTSEAIEWIAPIIQQQGLTEDQFDYLVTFAQSGSGFFRNRESVLELSLPPLPDEMLIEALGYFQNSIVESLQVRAGYKLMYHYAEDGVPTEIADTAAGNLFNSAKTGLIPVSLRLVRNARDNAEYYERKIVSAVGSYADRRDIYMHFLRSLYGRNVDHLVLSYAASEGLPSRFRSDVIGMLVTGGRTDATPEVQELLQKVARESKDHAVVQSAGRALTALGIDPPARVALTNRNNQSTMLFAVFAAMLLINSIAFLMGTSAILAPPAERERDAQDGARPVFRLVTWLLASTGMAILLVAAFIGFIGHNSAPPPAWTLGWNLPAYIGTALYVTAAYSIWTRSRRGRTSVTPRF